MLKRLTSRYSLLLVLITGAFVADIFLIVHSAQQVMYIVIASFLSLLLYSNLAAKVVVAFMKNNER